MKSERLTAADLVNLAYTPDLTQAGIAYALRSLPFTYDRMGGSPVDRLRRIVVGVAVELAFRRLLAVRGIPHDTFGATPFTDPDRYDVALGGRRCDLKSFLLFNKKDIRRLRREPARFLQASALVPVDQAGSNHFGDDDIYIFAFVMALLTRERSDLDRAIAAGQPIYLIHSMPPAWARPSLWASLHPLSLRSASSQLLQLELGGQGPDRSFYNEQLTLNLDARAQASRDFHTLAYLHAGQVPDGPVEVHSPRYGKADRIQPADWGNIWVYGMEVVLAGYLRRGEFRRQAEILPAGSRVLQYARTRTRNLALPISSLRPLSELFERVQRWDQRRAHRP
ncbi:MAG TPA: hypothetical protein VGA03_06450 [Anaerolineales bacterium]